MLVTGVVTVKLTATVCGVLVAPLAVMVIAPEYDPAVRPEVLTEAVMVPLFTPDVGEMVSQAALSLAVQLRVPVPELVRAMVWFIGFAPPWIAVKVSAVGFLLMTGAALSVSVTGIVLGVFDAPEAVTVIVAV